MQRSGKERGSLMNVLKGALVGCALSVALILLYAFVLKQQWLPMSTVPAVNTVIKVLSSAAAALIAVRRCVVRRFLFGGAAGLVYAALAFMIFSIVSDTFAFTLALLADLATGALTGMLAAMLSSLRG